MWLETELDIELLKRPAIEAIDAYAAYALGALALGKNKEVRNLLIHLRQTIDWRKDELVGKDNNSAGSGSGCGFGSEADPPDDYEGENRFGPD